MKNLYDVLNVTSDATQNEIKKAYRKRMMEIHPDKNGGAQHIDHDPVQHAYDVLSDPERRKRYDETGDDGDATSLIEQARNKVSQYVMQYINSSYNEKYTNMASTIKQHIATERQGLDDIKVGSEKMAKKLAEIRKRLHTGDGSGFVEAMVADMEKKIADSKQELEGEYRVLEEAERIAETIGYDVEEMVAVADAPGWAAATAAGERQRASFQNASFRWGK